TETRRRRGSARVWRRRRSRCTSRHPKRPRLGDDASQESQPRGEDCLRIADLDRPSRDSYALPPDAPNGSRSTSLSALLPSFDFRPEYCPRANGDVVRSRQLARIPGVFVQPPGTWRSEEHTSELQSRENVVCRLLLEKKNTNHGVA